MNWNPSYSYATLPAGSKNVPSYWITLTTRVPEQQGLPHFSDVHIWNIKATGATQAFEVSAYPNATLDNFRLDHLDIEAKTAGSIANTKKLDFRGQRNQNRRWQQSESHRRAGSHAKYVPFRRTSVVADITFGEIQHDYVGTVLHSLQDNFMAVWRNVEVVDFEVGRQVGQLSLSACLPVDNPEIFVLYFSPQNHEGPSSGKESQMPGPAGKFHGRQSVRFAFGSDGLNGKRGPNVGARVDNEASVGCRHRVDGILANK